MPGSQTQSPTVQEESTKIIDGSDIMLYIYKGDKYIPTASAKSHKLSYKTSTKTRTTKDIANSKWERKSVKTISTTISIDALVAVSKDGVTCDDLVKILKDGTSVKAKWGYKQGETGTTYEEGMFIVESLDINTPASDDATYSATLTNDGEIKTVQVGG